MIAVKALTIAILVLLAAACSARSGPGRAAGAAGPTVPAGAVVPVVAAESQYGDVLAQVGGPYVQVTSVMSDPNTDPHSFEVSTSVARAVSAARVVVQNGLGYDDFMSRIESAAPSRGRRVLVAQALLGLPGDTANPHLWCDPATMPRVADAAASALGACRAV